MKPNLQRTSLAVLALLTSAGQVAAAPQDVKVVPPPQAVRGEADFDEPIFQRSEPVTDFEAGYVETMEDVVRREARREPEDVIDKRKRNGRQGSWRVPGRRRSYRSHSGAQYVFNKWGDTRMGIGFNRVVDLEGAWVAGHGPVGGYFAKALQVVGYRDGQVVAQTEWHKEVGLEYSYFQMDLQGVDRIEIVAEAAINGAGWYGLDDLSFVDADGSRTLIDFEDLIYEDVLTGSGYAGLAWETGTGEFGDGSDSSFVPPPGAFPPPPGAGITPGGNGSDISSGNGTLPIFMKKFLGPTMGDPGAGYIPPDTCGAVGVDHFIAVVNMNISIYEKATGTRVVNTSMQSFFGTGGSAGDPRVVFDPDSQRWIVLATDFNNKIFLAVSSTPDPTGSWFKTSFNPSQGADAGKWPDYPTLGVDARWILTASYMVGSGSKMTLFCIEKAPLVAAAQSMGNISAFRGLSWEGAIQPCVHWEDPGAAYSVSWRTSSQLRIRRVDLPVNAPTMTSIFVNLSKSWSSPPSAPALGSPNLDTLDGRLMNSVFRMGHVWTAHAVTTNGRASSRYYELDPTGGGTEVQLGTVRDTVNQSLYFWNPSIAVNPQGHVVLGCTGSDANQWAGAYYTGRLASDPLGEMAEPFQYKPGQAAYNQQGGTQRWGDYSLTSADPTNDTVWTMQEFARTGNRWGNNIAKLGFADDCASNIVRYCDPSALGTQIDVDTCSLATGSINFTLSGGTPGLFGYLLVGAGSGIINNPPGAVGDLCLGGNTIGRYVSDLAVIDAAGQISTDVINGNTGGGAGNLPAAIGGTIQAGATWNWQYWSRHTGVPSTFSDALTVTFTN